MHVETFLKHDHESILEVEKPVVIVVPVETSLIQSCCQRTPRGDWRIKSTLRFSFFGYFVVEVSDKSDINIKHNQQIASIVPLPDIVRLDQTWSPIWAICEDRFSNQLLVILVVY